MNTLFKKPKGVSYTDMCIWIDNNIYEEGCDYNKAYTYMWLLAYMLACKAKYFASAEDYEDFASFLAYCTYARYMDKENTKIKSVLNYMKSIISFRKMAFISQQHQEIIDPVYSDFDSALYLENSKYSYEKSNHEQLMNSVLDILSYTPKIVKKCIPKVYKSDKVLFSNIYMSALLTLLNRFTLQDVHNERLENKLNSSPTFNEVNFYKKNLDDEIILWHVPDSLEPVIKVIINKVFRILVDEIKGISDDAKISDNEFNNILASGFATGGTTGETDN